MKDYNKTSLCKLVKKEFQVKEKDLFLELIKDSRFYCNDCGRSANKKKNLCNPIKIAKE